MTELSHAAIRQRVSDVASRGIIPIILGGDHSIMWPSVMAVSDAHRPKSVGVIHFDAHADTADEIEGNLASHGTPVRRLIESGAVEGSNFVQIGLRGYWPPADVFDWMRARGIRWYLMSEIDRRGLTAIVDEAIVYLSNHCQALYLSVDIDVLDPAFAPGTGTPEPGGLNPRELLTAVRTVALGTPLVAMDVVEVCPPYDISDVTINNAQRIIYEVLAGVASKRSIGSGTPTGTETEQQR